MTNRVEFPPAETIQKPEPAEPMESVFNLEVLMLKYKVDHDFHIHSGLSLCSGDPGQTPDRILQYAKENGLKEIVLTDHYWDETVPSCLNDFYAKQGYAHIAKNLPLPQADGIRFRFGCETDLDKHCTLGLAAGNFDRFDFVIIPTTHLQMEGFTIETPASIARRAELWVERLDAVLKMDLPFYKIGIAHLTFFELAGIVRGDVKWEHHIQTLDMIPDAELYRLFRLNAQKGAGIELNFDPFCYSEAQLPHILRIYRIAKECGCRFYFGSDAHHPADFEKFRERAERIVDLLELTENDKFCLPDCP